MSIKRAELLARFAHDGQRYGDQDYMYHLEGVAQKAVSFFNGADLGTTIITQIALLHDILEDTHISEEFLRANFDAVIVDAVVLLTKPKGFVRDEHNSTYIEAIKKNPYALLVKKADTLFNLEHSMYANNKKRIARYTAQLLQLSE